MLIMFDGILEHTVTFCLNLPSQTPAHWVTPNGFQRFRLSDNRAEDERQIKGHWQCRLWHLVPLKHGTALKASFLTFVFYTNRAKCHYRALIRASEYRSFSFSLGGRGLTRLGYEASRSGGLRTNSDHRADLERAPKYWHTGASVFRLHHKNGDQDRTHVLGLSSTPP